MKKIILLSLVYIILMSNLSFANGMQNELTSIIENTFNNTIFEIKSYEINLNNITNAKIYSKNINKLRIDMNFKNEPVRVLVLPEGMVIYFEKENIFTQVNDLEIENLIPFTKVIDKLKNYKISKRIDKNKVLYELQNNLEIVKVEVKNQKIVKVTYFQNNKLIMVDNYMNFINKILEDELFIIPSNAINAKKILPVLPE